MHAAEWLGMSADNAAVEVTRFLASGEYCIDDDTLDDIAYGAVVRARREVAVELSRTLAHMVLPGASMSLLFGWAQPWLSCECLVLLKYAHGISRTATHSIAPWMTWAADCNAAVGPYSHVPLVSLSVAVSHAPWAYVKTPALSVLLGGVHRIGREESTLTCDQVFSDSEPEHVVGVLRLFGIEAPYSVSVGEVLNKAVGVLSVHDGTDLSPKC